MTQSSEERVTGFADAPRKAEVLAFERPQSDLQRAVQARAQDHLEQQGIKPKTSPVRFFVTLAIALIPVMVIFGGYVVAVKAVRLITSLYIPAATPDAPASEGQIGSPTETQAAEPAEPGVVMLVPDQSATAPPSAQGAPRLSGD